MDDDSNYTSKQITKKHFIYEGTLQKTNTKPNKFKLYIKLTNLAIRIK